MIAESLSFVPSGRPAPEQGAADASVQAPAAAAPVAARATSHAAAHAATPDAAAVEHAVAFRAACAAPATAPRAGNASTGTPREDNTKAFSQTDSPCVAVCSTLFDEICRGCGRTAMEVSNWVFMSEEEKQQVWQRILAQGYPRR